MLKSSNYIVLYILLHLFCMHNLLVSNRTEYYGEYVPRVINGTPARLGDVPYQVSFRTPIKKYADKYRTFCGGVIIAPKKLLSAAHCFVKKDKFRKLMCGAAGTPKQLSHKFAVAGTLRSVSYHYSQFDSDNDENGQWRKMRRVIYPKTFDFPDDDIAIVFLYRPFIYNSNINYIPYASRLRDYHGKCLVSGYGRVSKTKLSRKLNLAEIDLIPMRRCNSLYEMNMRKFVCTRSKFTDIREGDSGGPLVCLNTGDPKEKDNRGILVGIVSGYVDGLGSFFTRVSSFHKYIDRNNCPSNNKTEYYGEYVPRVVNGTPAQLGDVPYQIAFKTLIRHSRIYQTFCGGVIIAPQKLLTAAHCFVEKQNICERICGGNRNKRALSHKFAVAGNLRNRAQYYMFDSEREGQWREMKSFVYPLTYNFPKDDIAIVFTYKPFIYNSYVNFIPYASRLIDYNGNCLVSGYGRISIRQKHNSDKLLLAELRLISMSRCNRVHRRKMRNFVCTSSRFTDVGKGDSGGPLVCRNTGDPREQGGKGILVGIVSGHRYGVGSFFTRVSSYHRYVDRNNCACTKLKMFVIFLAIQLKLLLFSFSFL